jgi:hypothetical protein
MTTQAIAVEQDEEKAKVKRQGGSPDAVYGLGMIGAWVFYIGRASSFREGALGFVKGIFWPAFVVYALLATLEKK